MREPTTTRLSQPGQGEEIACVRAGNIPTRPRSMATIFVFQQSEERGGGWMQVGESRSAKKRLYPRSTYGLPPLIGWTTRSVFVGKEERRYITPSRMTSWCPQSGDKLAPPMPTTSSLWDNREPVPFDACRADIVDQPAQLSTRQRSPARAVQSGWIHGAIIPPQRDVPGPFAIGGCERRERLL